MRNRLLLGSVAALACVRSAKSAMKLARCLGMVSTLRGSPMEPREAGGCGSFVVRSESGEIRLALFRKGGERLACGWAAHHATEARAFFFHALPHRTLLCQLHEPLGLDQC